MSPLAKLTKEEMRLSLESHPTGPPDAEGRVMRARLSAAFRWLVLRVLVPRGVVSFWGL
jgi:hypothetical protein